MKLYKKTQQAIGNWQLAIGLKCLSLIEHWLTAHGFDHSLNVCILYIYYIYIQHFESSSSSSSSPSPFSRWENQFFNFYNHSEIIDSSHHYFFYYFFIGQRLKSQSQNLASYYHLISVSNLNFYPFLLFPL